MDNETTNTTVKLLNLGPWIISAIALIQVWIIALWKKFVWTANLSIFKTGLLEVGYSNFGPTLAINGTLRAHRKNIFVREISITVTRDSDGSTHELVWTAFRSPQLRFAHTDPITLELPSGFNIQPDHPYRYHIFFSDYKTQTEIVPTLNDVINEWREYIVSHQDKINKIIHDTGFSEDVVIGQIYSDEFVSKSEAWQRAWDLLNRKIYWENGNYRMLMNVKTSSPDKSFSEEWVFSIDKATFDNLQLNAIATLRELCIRKIDYYFAYLEYK